MRWFLLERFQSPVLVPRLHALQWLLRLFLQL